MIIGELRKKERTREEEREPIRHPANAKLVILVRERSRLRLAKPANVASYVLKSFHSNPNQINEHASILLLDLKGFNVSLTAFEDVKYVKHLYIFLCFSSKEPKSQFFSCTIFLCNMLAIQCTIGCILCNFSLSQVHVRTGKLDRIGRFRDSHVRLQTSLKYQSQ